jgi:hypothetical protein
MKQALHIFGKDVRHLWPQIALVLLLVAAFAICDIQSRETIESIGSIIALGSGGTQLWVLKGLLAVLIPATYAWLIVTLVHQEALPGDRQFWLIRPYSPKSLLSAKILFIVLFVSLTMLAKDCFIVAAQGFPIFSYIPGLLLRLLVWTAWVVLPALAAGVVTRNLQEAGLLGAGVALVYAMQGILVRKSFWPGVDWVREYSGVLLLLVLPAAIVVWQYSRRETAKARIAVACCTILVLIGLPLLPGRAAFAIQTLARRPGIDLNQVQLTPDLGRPSPANPASEIPQGPVGIALPVRLGGVPAGMALMPDGTRVIIISGQHEVWRSPWRQGWYGMKAEAYRSQAFPIDNSVYRSLRDQLVNVKLSLAFTVIQDEQPVRISAHERIFLLQGRRCQDLSPEKYPPEIWCLAAVRDQPRNLVGIAAAGILRPLTLEGGSSYAPYDAALGLSPLVASP